MLSWNGKEAVTVWENGTKRSRFSLFSTSKDALESIAWYNIVRLINVTCFELNNKVSSDVHTGWIHGRGMTLNLRSNSQLMDQKVTSTRPTGCLWRRITGIENIYSQVVFKDTEMSNHTFGVCDGKSSLLWIFMWTVWSEMWKRLDSFLRTHRGIFLE